MKVSKRLNEININQDSSGIPLVKAFIACNPSKGLSLIAQLHAQKEFTFESNSDAACVALNFLLQFQNVLGCPGGTDMDAGEKMLAGGEVTSCLAMLRADEFIVNKEKSNQESLAASAAVILISLLLSVSTRRGLYSGAGSDLRANNFIDVLTPFASAK